MRSADSFASLKLHDDASLSFSGHGEIYRCNGEQHKPLPSLLPR